MDTNELKNKLKALSNFKPETTETIIRSNAGLVIKQEKSMNPKTESNPRGAGREKGKPQPHLVKYHGEEGDMRLSWSRMKAQAKFRNEPFELTFDEFKKFWQGQWHLRGRGGDDLVLTRIDESLSWSVSNCAIVKRSTISRECQKGRWK